MAMNKDDQRQWITLAGVALAGFVVIEASGGIKSLLEKLGRKKSEDEKNVDQAQNTSLSFWSPAFWQAGPAGTMLLTTAAATNIVNKIVDAYTLWYVDHTVVTAALKSLHTQSQLSYLVYMFEQLQDQDLLTWLREKDVLRTWPYQRLSDEEINNLTTYFNTLPKYF